MNERNDMTASDSIINRHMARLLSELEDAGCPVIFRDAVKSKLSWLRKDLNELKETKGTPYAHTAAR
jgi:hypothetical protein